MTTEPQLHCHCRTFVHPSRMSFAMTHMIRLAATCALLCTTTWTSAALLLSQGPNLTTADAVANGTDFQAPLLAETIG